ncbi:hypothetical protein MQP27_20845 [Streptomyces sp. 7R015]|uniref:Uncharacterized protein n=1 Tax=Streptomyces cylindrosporus TaxID=2927583 RepID=A0ABS9Y8J1_9ACTN|nr:hypothetical protein [Streptomyces cylindrosporus]MCI3273545.1 hypothetical protein [Streptomyces cylindrosporus]
MGGTTVTNPERTPEDLIGRSAAVVADPGVRRQSRLVLRQQTHVPLGSPLLGLELCEVRVDDVRHAAVEAQDDALADQFGAEGDGGLPERDHAVLGRLALGLDHRCGRQGLVRADAAPRLGPAGPAARHDQPLKVGVGEGHRAGPDELTVEQDMDGAVADPDRDGPADQVRAELQALPLRQRHVSTGTDQRLELHCLDRGALLGRTGAGSTGSRMGSEGAGAGSAANGAEGAEAPDVIVCGRNTWAGVAISSD